MDAAKLQNLIRDTVQAVLRERAAKAASPKTAPAPAASQTAKAEPAKPEAPRAAQILVAVCCSECLRPEVTAALDELKSAGFVLIEPGAHELKERATRERLVAKSDVVLLPSLGDDDAAKIALGIFDEPASRVALSALALGKPLIASPHSPYDGALKSRSPVLFNLWQSYRRTLENFGFEIVEAASLSGAVQAHLAPKTSQGATSTAGASASNGKRIVITAQHIEAAARNGKSFDVPSGALVTPLARDRARELGVKI